MTDTSPHDSPLLQYTRCMSDRIRDGMRLVEKYGKPSVFITFTMNPGVEEVATALHSFQQPSDRYKLGVGGGGDSNNHRNPLTHLSRPEIIAMVFQAKLERLIELVWKRQVLGHADAYMYSVEFQKR